LGGRLDATNVVKPVLSVITSISIDHTTFLGNTLPLIAAEKGGIIKPEVPVVVAKQKDEAKSVLRAIAAERKSEWIDIEDKYGSIPVEEHAFSQKIGFGKERSTSDWLNGLKLKRNQFESLIYSDSIHSSHQTDNQ
jgi:dihydrofolate synthase/folylpolyglutamate synthase